MITFLEWLNLAIAIAIPVGLIYVVVSSCCSMKDK